MCVYVVIFFQFAFSAQIIVEQCDNIQYSVWKNVCVNVILCLWLQNFDDIVHLTSVYVYYKSILCIDLFCFWNLFYVCPLVGSFDSRLTFFFYLPDEWNSFTCTITKYLYFNKWNNKNSNTKKEKLTQKMYKHKTVIHWQMQSYNKTNS